MVAKIRMSIHWHDESGAGHVLCVPAGWAEQEVSLLVDQINRGAFKLENDSAIDLSDDALDLLDAGNEAK